MGGGGRCGAGHESGNQRHGEDGSTAKPMIIPFTRACVPVVDIPGGQITVLPPYEIEVREDLDGDVDHADGAAA